MFLTLYAFNIEPFKSSNSMFSTSKGSPECKIWVFWYSCLSSAGLRTYILWKLSAIIAFFDYFCKDKTESQFTSACNVHNSVIATLNMNEKSCEVNTSLSEADEQGLKLTLNQGKQHAFPTSFIHAIQI